MFTFFESFPLMSHPVSLQLSQVRCEICQNGYKHAHYVKFLKFKDVFFNFFVFEGCPRHRPLKTLA